MFLFFIGKAIDVIFPGPNLVEFGRLKLVLTLLLFVYILDGVITFFTGVYSSWNCSKGGT